MIIFAPRPSVQEIVYVANNVTDGKAVIVHCQSGDDDLGGFAVAVGYRIHWQFSPNLFGGTLFWCKLAFEDRRASFVAYDQRTSPETVKWTVNDDGVYGKLHGGTPYLHAAWVRVFAN
ncbi:unnamed protein product [Linum trigynum]|uniref:S-protein homolog n=1 Tax=Linum trigynum TaxID=586398 RepID=A0AAV2CQE8_9ROSI